MPRALWIADVCRDWGLDVVEVDGWRTRGSTDFAPRALVAHHTAGPAAGDYPSLRIVRDGRSDLPGPLSQVGLGRTGRVYVVAAGRANHAGGRYDVGWRGVRGNRERMGIEAESVGTRDDWTPEQRRAYPLLCAALLDGMGVRDARMLCGHRETATNKVDPVAWDMDAMRAQVARHLADGPRRVPTVPTVPPPPKPAPSEEDSMLVQAVRAGARIGGVYLVGGGVARGVPTQAQLDAARAIHGKHPLAGPDGIVPVDPEYLAIYGVIV